jgi:hypothetical protein
MTTPDIPVPSNSTEYALAVGGLFLWSLLSTVYFLYLKFGGKKDATNSGITTSRIQEQLAQDKIRIDRSERDIAELRATNDEIRRAQSEAMRDITAIIYELKGILNEHRGKK